MRVEKLEPMVDNVCGIELHHGERGSEVDPEHPEACFCGAPYYLHCEAWINDEDGFLGLTISASEPEPGAPQEAGR